jgi:acetyl esterase/lipase
MKKILLSLMFMSYVAFGYSQESGQHWADLNYANDNKVYHNLDIYLPKSDKSKFKAIVVIYGSAWFGNNFKQSAYESLGKPLLANGFAVITINHRASFDSIYPAQINDVKAAVRFIRANAAKYQIDTSFIGITGFSSGGHLSALAGASNSVKKYTVGQKTVNIEGSVGNYTSYSSKVDAVVDWFGPIDMTRMDGGCTKPKDDKSPEAALIHGNPADNLDMLALISPITFLNQNSPHFLVIHGDADSVVPYCQSVLFSNILKEKGLLDEFVTVPNGQHGPVTFNETTFKKMVDFFIKESNKK